MKTRRESGIVLVSTLMLMFVILALLGVYFTTAQHELEHHAGSAKSLKGFMAAEAALNIRAEEIRGIFVGYNVPVGTAPVENNACEGLNQGGGDFICREHDINNRAVTSYVEGNNIPTLLTIPANELYSGLTAQEFRYTARAEAYDQNDRPEALLELNFMSRLVPLFQFAAFYDKDLEILPGPNMNLNGPIHTNGDLYLNSDATLTINGQVTTVGTTYRGRKNDGSSTGTVRLYDPASPRTLNSTGSRRTVLGSEVAVYNGRLRLAVDDLVVPEPGLLSPTQGEVYWDKADLRLVLRLDAGTGLPITSVSSPTNTTGVWVANIDGTWDIAKTTSLNTCAIAGGELASNRAVASTNTFYNNRGNTTIRMLEVDLRRLLRCIQTGNLFGAGKNLSDSTEGGIVMHFSISGPNSALNPNNYGVRVRNAQEIRSSTTTDPIPRGLTLVSDQAFYTYGNYNSTNWKPAAILADSLNVLSRNWNDPGAPAASGCPASGNRCATNSGGGTSNVSTTVRNATNTDLYVAFLSGTDTSGGVEGSAGQNGSYNGGLENYPRFHEYWTNISLTYRGSFVSLGIPEHVNGAWIYGGRYYTAPNRNWDYDIRFNDAANLPPLSPRFVYLRQELFVRDYSQ